MIKTKEKGKSRGMKSCPESLEGGEETSTGPVKDYLGVLLPEMNDAPVLQHSVGVTSQIKTTDIKLRCHRAATLESCAGDGTVGDHQPTHERTRWVG